MEQELNNKIRETAQEIDDGAFQTWCENDNNKKQLISGFLEHYQEEFESWCKDRWNEENE